jgi:hypothetical protein
VKTAFRTSGAVFVGEHGQTQVRSDLFGNVNYGAMMALFGVDEDDATSASNASLPGTGRFDLDDDSVVRVGYEVVRSFPNGMTSREYLTFTVANNPPALVRRPGDSNED